MNTAQTLREYQKEIIVAVKMAWQRLNKNQQPIRAAISVATGGGKTTILAQLVRDVMSQRGIKQCRALVIAHREEIIFQLKERIRNQFEELEQYYVVNGELVPGIGVVMGTYDDCNARIVIATQQSLSEERLAKILSAGAIDLYIVDEAHHDQKNTYERTENILRSCNPALLKLGVSATWKRTDKKALGTSYDEILEPQVDIVYLVDRGYLVPPTALKVTTGIDLSDVSNVSGDYNSKQLVSILEAANWTELSVEAYQTYIQGRYKHTLAFFPNLAMSRIFVQHLQEIGVNAAHLDKDTPKEIRREMLRAFSRGDVPLISNFGVLTEGVDLPITDSIFWARPTRSETVLTQCLGRGLRPALGKSHCLFLDIAAKDTKALTKGSLSGKLRKCKSPDCNAEFFLGFKLCPVCGLPTGAGEVTAREDSEEGLGRIHTPKAGIMAGLSAEIVPLLDQLAAAWYHDNLEYMSVSCGIDAGALVIAPPTWQDIERQRERLYRGEHLLNSIPPEKKEALLSNMTGLRREIQRAEHYTLWFVPKSGLDPIEFIRGNGDLSALLAEADIEAIRRGGKDTKKISSWRSGDIEASPRQRGYLYRLGVPNELIPQPLYKDMAARIITHYLAVPRVQYFIENDVLEDVHRKVEVA